MTWLAVLAAAAVLLVLAVGAAVVAHLRGYPLTDWRPVRKPPAPKRKRARHYPGPRPGSEFADLEVRAPLYGHPTKGLTAEQIAAALAEGRTKDGA